MPAELALGVAVGHANEQLGIAPEPGRSIAEQVPSTLTPNLPTLTPDPDPQPQPSPWPLALTLPL